jgi:mxaJ protein
MSRELGRRLEYFWLPQRRGFIRNTLRTNRCDLVVGVPAKLEAARPTQPYYRSSYVFVSRRDRDLRIESLDDPLLRALKIGIQITGEDYGNPPPAQALASRRIAANVRGFMVYGDYAKPDPQRAVVDAVARGDVDVAIVWGPIAGYYAKQARVPLRLTAVTPDHDGPLLPFAFDIAMAVRRDDDALRDAIDRAIGRRVAAIRRILDDYGVPRSALSARADGR